MFPQVRDVRRQGLEPRTRWLRAVTDMSIVVCGQTFALLDAFQRIVRVCGYPLLFEGLTATLAAQVSSYI
jgi:hypothetical protein